jgi:hypothetical protein
MTLHHFIRRISPDDVAFAKFDHNFNFIPIIFYLMLLHDQAAMETFLLDGFRT